MFYCEAQTSWGRWKRSKNGEDNTRIGSPGVEVEGVEVRMRVLKFKTFGELKGNAAS